MVIISLNIPKYLQSGMSLVCLEDGNYAAGTEMGPLNLPVSEA